MAPMHFRPRSTAAPSDVKKRGRPRSSLTERELEHATDRFTVPIVGFPADDGDGAQEWRGFPAPGCRWPPSRSVSSEYFTGSRAGSGTRWGGVGAVVHPHPTPQPVGPVTSEDGLGSAQAFLDNGIAPRPAVVQELGKSRAKGDPSWATRRHVRAFPAVSS